MKKFRKDVILVKKFSHKTVRIKVFSSNFKDLKSTDEISLILMFLDENAVIHMMDTATSFSTATLLDSHGKTYG